MMENYIVVHFFYDNTSLALARSVLEREGIRTQTKDEETMQVLSVLEARAIGGAKLLVQEKDYIRASEIMIEMGLMNADTGNRDFWFVDYLDKIAILIVGTKVLNKDFRLVLISFLMLSIPLLVIMLLLIY